MIGSVRPCSVGPALLAATMHVDYVSIRIIENLPAGFLNTIAEVRFFAVHEIVGIEQAYFFQHRTTYQHETSHNAIDLPKGWPVTTPVSVPVENIAAPEQL